MNVTPALARPSHVTKAHPACAKYLLLTSKLEMSPACQPLKALEELSGKRDFQTLSMPMFPIDSFIDFPHHELI